MIHLEPDDNTSAQLLEMGYDGDHQSWTHSRPVLVCDVDEVVLHLVDPFEQVLEENGFYLKNHSFRLTGNVYHRETGREATQEEVWAGLTQLFDEQDRRQSLVDGVVDNLNALSEAVDIVFLTNMPHEFRDIRRKHLSNHGLDFPLITNSRSKVPAIKHIKRHCPLPVGFIDDTPKNLEQVRDNFEDVHLFHFMANEAFRELAGAVEGVRFSSGDWIHTRENIHTALVENTR